jgi:hypothetical protein
MTRSPGRSNGQTFRQFGQFLFSTASSCCFIIQGPGRRTGLAATIPGIERLAVGEAVNMVDEEEELVDKKDLVVVVVVVVVPELNVMEVVETGCVVMTGISWQMAGSRERKQSAPPFPMASGGVRLLNMHGPAGYPL